ncbi:MAG: hypothetical protein FWG68_12630 [Defluviitaleaceae bacterium]|nr:hypothetical protein [Defluviitaleaceae bacterium]
MELYKYEDKYVKIKSISGKTYIGFVDIYTHKLDDPDGRESIDIIPYNIPNWEKRCLLGLYEDEIVQIETIEPIEIIIYPKTYQPQVVAV